MSEPHRIAAVVLSVCICSALFAQGPAKSSDQLYTRVDNLNIYKPLNHRFLYCWAAAIETVLLNKRLIVSQREIADRIYADNTIETTDKVAEMLNNWTLRNVDGTHYAKVAFTSEPPDRLRDFPPEDFPQVAFEGDFDEPNIEGQPAVFLLTSKSGELLEAVNLCESNNSSTTITLTEAAQRFRSVLHVEVSASLARDGHGASDHRVVLTSNQALLFRHAHDNLASYLDELRDQVQRLNNSLEATAPKELLSLALDRGTSEVLSVRDSFYATAAESQWPAADAFFSEILTRHRDARMHLNEMKDETARPERPQGLFFLDENRSRNDLKYYVGTVMQALALTADAFQTVSREASLTFPLEVRSVPRDATVLYKRKGDDFVEYPEKTDTQIWCEWGIWTIRVHKAGYVDQDKSYDPYEQRIHSIRFDLQPIKAKQRP